MDNIMADYDFVKIGKRIKGYRKEHGITQEALASELHDNGIRANRHTIRRIENGEPGDNFFDILLILCDIFKTDIGHLLGEYEARTRTIAEISAVTGLSINAVEALHYATLPESAHIDSETQEQNKRTVSFINRALESVSAVDEKDGGRRSVETIFSIMEDYVCSTGAWIEDKRTGEAVPAVTVNFDSSESSVVTVREFLSVHLMERIRNVLDALRRDHDEKKQ